MANLEIEFCGVRFDNPFILPSGIITEIKSHSRAIVAGAGGITFKSLTIEPRGGNPLPRIAKYEHGFLNSVGLANPGIEEGVTQIKDCLHANRRVPVIVSLFASSVVDFVILVEKSVNAGADFIELNLSCPNVRNEFGRPVAENAQAAEEIIKAVKRVSGKVKILAKLSPNVCDIASIAKACEEGGADGIVAINTVGPGMVIDIDKKKPILGAAVGGLSGPGIFPVSVRCVYDIYKSVRIPIIGMGGVTSWRDVVQIMMAGATLVGVGSATYLKGIGVFGELREGLANYMENNGIPDPHYLVGVSHLEQF